MERNDNFGAGFDSGTTGGSGGAGSTGGAFGGTSGSLDQDSSGGGLGASSGSGASFGAAGGAGSAAEGLGDRLNQGSDRAADKLGAAKDKLSDKLGSAKERASELKATLADKLEAGAEKLRGQGGRSGSGDLALAGGSVATNAHLSEPAARGADLLQGAADFLREGDLKAAVEEQVKEHPARTLLIALGVGYVLGKALRR